MTQISNISQIAWSNPLTRGLSCFYVLDSANWSRDIVTGKIGGTGVAAFNGRYLQTTGAASGNVSLATNLSSLSGPLTFVTGLWRISGSVPWSLLDRTADTWYGYYAGDTDTLQVTQANDFAGGVTVTGPMLGPIRNSVYVLANQNNLYGAAKGGSLVIDTSVNVPAFTTMPTSVQLGYSKRGSGYSDNPAVAVFSHFGIYNRALSRSEVLSLAADLGQLFSTKQRRKIYGFSGVPTVYRRALYLKYS